MGFPYISALILSFTKKPCHHWSRRINSGFFHFWYKLEVQIRFKILSKEYASDNISCINIAPGPINTDRTQELVENVKEFGRSLPMKRLGEPEEIGKFVKSIVQNNIKYLSGVVINFDGANSNYIF